VWCGAGDSAVIWLALYLLILFQQREIFGAYACWKKTFSPA
jgi:hypothetical protein